MNQQQHLNMVGRGQMLQQQQQQPQQQQQQQQHIGTVQKLVRRGHQLELLQQAKVLCDRQNYVDLTIFCEDGVVKAHQMLLATASPFLKMLFKDSPMYEKDEISIILPEVKACLVQALVHFVYTGTVVSKEDHFYSLMKLVYALNINASIEAESTNEKPTAFSAPLTIKREPPQLQQHFQPQPQHHLQQQQQPPQPPMKFSLPTVPQPPQLPTQPVVSLPTQPVPPAKIPRMSGAGSQKHQSQQQQVSIQLPTQPVPIAGMVNGAGQVTAQKSVAELHPGHQQQQQQQQSTSSYIAVDPNTGFQYKVEMPNGPAGGAGAGAASGGDASADPLAAIMNETIFTDTSGAVYTAENGQVVYTTTTSSGNIVPSASQPAPPPPQGMQPTTSTPAKGKKRKVGGGAVKGNKENHQQPQILAGEDGQPITAANTPIVASHADEEDAQTSYTCQQCNKTVKGRIMLQAHIYQEHHENPGLASLDLTDKHACRVCLKIFTRNSDVKAHILRVHCGDRRYPCTMCGKRFKESTHLRKHLYTHTGERPHFCTYCNKGFQTSSDLKRHCRTRVHQERERGEGGSGTDMLDNSGTASEKDGVDADGDLSHMSEDAGGDFSAGGPGPQQPQAQPVAVTTATTTGAAQTVPKTVEQELLNSIVAPTAPAAVAQPVTLPASTASAAATSSSTIDMKALGGATTWNNNNPSAQQQLQPVQPPPPQQQQQQQQQNPSSVVPTSSSTIDLKAITGDSTVDINALKWNEQQQQPQPIQQQQQEPLLQQPQQPPPAPQNPTTSLPLQAIKRSSSVDSPSQDEERLTVVEGDDSSQDNNAAAATAGANNSNVVKVEATAPAAVS